MHESRKADKMSNLVKDSMPKNQLDRRHKKDKKREIKIAHLTALIIGKHISIKRFLQDMAEEEGKRFSHHFYLKMFMFHTKINFSLHL